MKRFLRSLGFVVFGGPLIVMGILFLWFGLEEAKAALVLVAVVWTGCGIAFGRHAASGFTKQTLLTAAIAAVAMAVTISVTVHLQNQGARSVSELMFGGYIFFFLVWAMIAVPVTINRGLRRLWREREKRQRQFAIAVPVCGALAAFAAYACWKLEASLPEAIVVVGLAALIFALAIAFYCFAGKQAATDGESK